MATTTTLRAFYNFCLIKYNLINKYFSQLVSFIVPVLKMPHRAWASFQVASQISSDEDLQNIPDGLTHLLVDTSTPFLKSVLDKFHDTLTHLVVGNSSFFPAELTYGSLKSLSILNCNISDDGVIEKLAKNVPRLEELNLGNYKCATDNHVLIFTAETSNLKRLRMEGCEELSLNAVEFVLTHCKNLEKAEFDSCFRQMSEENLQIMEKLGQLEDIEAMEWGECG